MRIPSVFKRDTNGLVIPEFMPGMHWVLEKGASVLSTVKLDGITIKVQHQMNGWVVYKEGKGVTPDGWVPSDRANAADKLLWEALDNSDKEGLGIYVAYGPGIKGNPQNVTRPLMIKVLPVANCLIMYGGVSGINRASTVQVLYESLRLALLDGDAEGVVFQWEEPQMKLKAWGEVTRRDFGFLWPIPAPVTPSQALSLVGQARP